MKKILILFAALNLILMIALAGLFVLSEIYPLRPGAAFYGVQHTAEQWRLRLASGNVRPAVFALDLAERRLADLASARGEEQMQAALVTFDRALNEAVRRLGAAPAAVAPGQHVAEGISAGGGCAPGRAGLALYRGPRLKPGQREEKDVYRHYPGRR